MSRRPDSLVKAVVGKLGSGKSWYCVGKILDALMAGEVVVTNLELNWAAVELFCAPVKIPRGNYRYVSSAEIAENPDCLLEVLTEGSLLVVDEVHLFLNARLWRENQVKAKQFLEFLTQARKLDIDCYLISQDERNVDSQLVRMCTHIVRLINWQHLPVLGKVVPLPLTVAAICSPDGVTSIGREYVWRVGGLGKCYNSKQRFTAISLTGDKAAPVRGKRAKSMSYGMMMVASGCGCLLLGRAMDYREARKAEESVSPVVDAKPGAKMPGAVPVVGAPAAASAAPVAAAQGLFTVPRPELVTAAERASIEAQLPGIYRIRKTHIVLDGGQQIYPGAFFLAGRVTGWRTEGGTVLLKMQSPNIPEIRLYHARGPKHSLYDFNGGVVRNTGRLGSGIRPGVAPGFTGVAQSGDAYGSGVSGSSGPVGSASSVAGYSAPEPFRSLPLRALGPVLGPRVGKPNPATGFNR